MQKKDLCELEIGKYFFDKSQNINSYRINNKLNLKKLKKINSTKDYSPECIKTKICNLEYI